MNERIKELAIEWADQLDWDFPSDPKEYTFSSIALEKFAELIVRECIAQVRRDENGPAYEAVGRIASHFFGVEE